MLHWTQSLYTEKKIKKVFEDYGRLYFFLFIERRWWVLWGGVSFWHTMILLLLFCYLITIPKHINDMEDLLSHPIWCLSFVAFALISLLSFYFFIYFSYLFWFYQMQLMKKKTERKTKTNINQSLGSQW